MPDHSGHDRKEQRRSFWHSRAILIFLGFAGIALVLLWEEHRAHILGALPYLLLLACSLMHLFGGHRHGSHRNDRNESDVRDKAGRSYEEVQ
jgi:Protein of unknown function (DUF2933)